MAHNQTGIAIVIKAFLPTGKTLDETFMALSIVKRAHESGDYAPLLAAAKVEEVKTEQKTRRVEAEPVTEETTNAKPVAQEENASEHVDRGGPVPNPEDHAVADPVTEIAAE